MKVEIELTAEEIEYLGSHLRNRLIAFDVGLLKPDKRDEILLKVFKAIELKSDVKE